MKKYILVLLLTMLTPQLYARITDNLTIGFGGGYESYDKFRGEFYVLKDIQMFKRNAELKLGVNNRSYQLDFDGVKDLDAMSFSLFGDVAVYPFNKGFFTGLRWELINFNWLSSESKIKVEKVKDYSLTSLYTGTCMFLQIGYKFRLSDYCALRVYAQPGFQQFRITNGTSSSGTYVFTPSDDNLVIEDHYEFIYNLNVSIEFRSR